MRPTEPDPHAPPLPPPVRTLVRSREQNIWCVNNEGLPVDYGLVVSFREAQDARWFLDQPQRASRVDVVAGEIVTFHEDADAEHFIEQGLAERVNKCPARWRRGRGCPGLDGCWIAATGGRSVTSRAGPFSKSRAMRSGLCSHGPDMEARRRSALRPYAAGRLSNRTKRRSAPMQKRTGNWRDQQSYGAS